MNRRGWMKIAEACIAILIVLAMLLVMTRNNKLDNKQDLSIDIPAVLDEIARTELFREKIISEDLGIKNELKNFIKSKLPQLGIEFELLICSTTEPCTFNPTLGKDVYTDERIISGAIALGQSNPKRLRLFVWR